MAYDRDELMPKILDLLESGRTLRQIARLPGMPAPATVVGWSKDAAWTERYARAREAGWHAIAEEVIELADDGSNDTYLDDDGRARVDHDVIARSRLRFDARRWLLSKMLPKVYGDATAPHTTNVQVNATVVDGLDRLTSTDEGRAAVRVLLREVAGPSALSAPETNGHAGNGKAPEDHR